MALYNNAKKEAVKRPFYYVEIDCDGTTFRFCLDRSPVPPGLDAAPFVAGTPSFGATSIDPEGGIGIRGRVTVNIRDHNDETELSTPGNPVDFWPLWRATYPYYQGFPMRVYSGYLDDKFTFDTNAFQARHYLLDSFKKTSSGVSITGRDPLKFADNDRAQYPPKSTGYLSADITDTATSITLLPTGAGDANHGTSGIIRINDEIMTYTRTSGSDTLTVVRAQYNTVADAHDADDTVQECVEIQDTIDNILYLLLVTGAGLDSSYIPTSKWAAERSAYLPGNYYTLLTEPVGIKTMLKELGMEAPHRLYWDERLAEISFVAIKDFSSSVPTWTDEGELLADTVSWQDKLDMRVSTVIVNFGIYDYAKDLDEITNYQQGYLRIDPDSVSDYGSQKIKTINCRWINNDNKAAAILLAARWGRRYSKAPIEISFQLDSKDTDVWTAGNAYVNTRTIVDNTNARIDLPVEVMSAQESDNFSYTCLEHSYGQALSQDEGVDEGVLVVQLSGELDQLKDAGGTVRTLRDVFDDLYPSFDPDDEVRIIFDTYCVAGSSDNTQPAVSTGSWSDFTNPPILDIRGLIVGTGGDGGNASTGGATDGGLALSLDDDVQIDNSGTIGGGGGGGGRVSDGESGVIAVAAGGGGAGYFNGARGTGSFVSPSGNEIDIIPAQDGTNTAGGAGARVTASSPSGAFTATGGAGGGLGQAGGESGGAAGAAIERNGYTITWINTGTVLGADNP